MNDKQFYTKVKYECLKAIPFVDDFWGICYIFQNTDDNPLTHIILKIVEKNHFVDRPEYFSTRKVLIDMVKCTPQWYHERIFLLNEIIRYCEYKLNQLK